MISVGELIPVASFRLDRTVIWMHDYGSILFCLPNSHEISFLRSDELLPSILRIYCVVPVPTIPSPHLSVTVLPVRPVTLTM